MEPIKLYDPSSSTFNNRRRIYKDGIELEKGVLINPTFLQRNKKKILEWCQIFSAYPDIYLDLITPETSNFKLFPYQRVFLRACMRYQNIFITASRATSKTFLSILGKYLQCMFSPNHVGSIVAPNKTQAAKISKQKIEEIWRIFPLLKKEVFKANFGKDYVDLFFKNGSRLSIVGALDSDRGLRTHATLIDEARKTRYKIINNVA